MALTKPTKTIIDGMDTSSITATGYQKFPGGLIMQWGYASTVSSSVVVTFPIAFPTACINTMVTQYAAGDTGGTDAEVSISVLPTTTSVTFSCPSRPFYWLALGY